MRDVEAILDRSDVNEILDKDTEEFSEELKEFVYDQMVRILVDVLTIL